jgi:HlyD family secretion protein
MDVPRSGARPRLRRVVVVASTLVALAAVTIGARWYANRAPAVTRGELWVADVQRGTLALEVRGTGTLVPDEFRWAAAPVAARVDRVLVQPGAEVAADTVLLELVNPDAELAALEADRDVAAAEAELARLSAQLDAARLAQESTIAGLDADVAIAQRRDAIDTAMADKGVESTLESAESKDRAAQLAQRRDFEKRRLVALHRGDVAQLDAQRGQVERLRSLAAFRKKQLDALHVRAGQAGVVQQVAVEAGQAIAVGAPLAKIVVPDKLKARLRVPEASTEDLALGLAAMVDTRNGVVAGRVIRIDPAAQNGSVTVDVAIAEALPHGTRVDQSVDGTIALARTADVLHVARPAVGEAHQTVKLWKLEAGEAHRVTVKFGRAAVKDIEIASGLDAGDQIVLSDISRWDGLDRLRIE